MYATDREAHAIHEARASDAAARDRDVCVLVLYNCLYDGTFALSPAFYVALEARTRVPPHAWQTRLGAGALCVRTHPTALRVVDALGVEACQGPRTRLAVATAPHGAHVTIQESARGLEAVRVQGLAAGDTFRVEWVVPSTGTCDGP